MEEIVEVIRDGFAPGDFVDVARNIPSKGSSNNKTLKWVLVILGAATVSLIAWHCCKKNQE